MRLSPASWLIRTGIRPERSTDFPAQVIRYATDRLIKGQLIGAAIGSAAFLVIGIFVAAGSRKRRVAASPATVGPTG